MEEGHDDEDDRARRQAARVHHAARQRVQVVRAVRVQHALRPGQRQRGLEWALPRHTMELTLALYSRPEEYPLAEHHTS